VADREPAPLEAATSPGAGEAEDARDREERVRREDRLWREAANREAQALRRYALLVPGSDVEVFEFLLTKFQWASELGPRRPENLEGLFFNRVFFAAGRWGKDPEFRRAWVYLLRGLGMELEPGVEQSVVRVAEEIFDRGLRETEAIETAVFGIPLEGGDPRHWQGDLPSLAECDAAWDLRNTACLKLYEDFLDSLGRVLPPKDYEALLEFFDLFNLAT
jgi:hypothetical protein